MAQTRGKAGSKQRELEDAALDALLGEGADPTNPAELGAVFRQIPKRLAERMLAGELTEQLGYAPGDEKPAAQENYRNGTTPKTVRIQHPAPPSHLRTAHTTRVRNRVTRRRERTTKPSPPTRTGIALGETSPARAILYSPRNSAMSPAASFVSARRDIVHSLAPQARRGWAASVPYARGLNSRMSAGRWTSCTITPHRAPHSAC